VAGVKRQLALVIAGLVAVLMLAGQLARATAGPEPNDPQDLLPAWTTDSGHIAFERTVRGQTSRVLAMTAGGKSLHVIQDGTLRGWVPGTNHLLVQVDGEHTFVQSDSSRSRPLAEFLGADATASPDGQRVAYLRKNALYVAAIDGSGERTVATGVAPPSWDILGPVWSPDGTRIVIASGSSLLLVQANGSSSRVLFTGDNQSVNPSWASAGGAVAFERNAAARWQIWLVNVDGTDAHELLGGAGANYRYPQFSTADDSLAFISDRQHALGGATQYQFALYVRDTVGTIRKVIDDVHPYSPPRWDPNGPFFAVSGGQECRRWGIYVPAISAGSPPHRRSNLCRVTGTAHADFLEGSPYFDLINGLGGNDILDGNAGNDKISGNNGDDTIRGGAGNDFIFGGPGNDRIFGGPGNDTIIGGNGVDRIDCGPGNDTVEAAGPRDIIARNCEHIRH
jgi:Ca2+-binding RTX toxin-like protein